MMQSTASTKDDDTTFNWTVTSEEMVKTDGLSY